MKFDHENSWFYKQESDTFKIEYSFDSVLDTGDSLSTFTASIFNSSDEDKTASMIRDNLAYTSEGEFVIFGGTGGETYNIKVIGTTAAARVYVYYITCEVFGAITLNTKIGTIDSSSYVLVSEANDYIRRKYGHSSKWDTLDIHGKRRILVEAAREIDAFNFIGEKYYDSQALQFPRDDHEVVTGNCATPITTSSFKNTSLKSDTYGKYPTDYWKYGTCHIVVGTPLSEVLNITLSNATTGAVTFSGTFSELPTENTQFKIFSPIPKEVKYAQIEQALFIVENANIETLQNYREIGASEVTIGEVSVKFGSGGNSTSRIPLAPLSRKLLSKFIRRQLRIGRA